MNTPSLWNDPKRAWEEYKPSQDRPWDRARVHHLHRRAGFLPGWGEVDRDLKQGPAASIDQLLNGESTSRDGQQAAAFETFQDAMAARLAPGSVGDRLAGLWLYRMIFTPHPLRERMTLFWHNHFATSNAKVQNPSLMQRQNNLLRTHALGDFKELLAEIGKDPAMLIWLDSTANRKSHPNENYAREVMELFTLGRGHYSEKDIQEAARAFTGWFVVRDQFSELKAQHDVGPKTVLGKTGSFDGDDIPPILLEQPACSEFLARKLFRQFVSEVDEPPSALLAPLAARLRSSGYDIKAAVAMILRSNLFHDDSCRRRRVKSPAEFAVGIVRALGIFKPTVSAEGLAKACTGMGQTLFAPPSVAGWDGGPAWINTTTLLARSNLALGIASKDDAPFGNRVDLAKLAETHGASKPKDIAAFYVDLLAPDGFGGDVRERLIKDVVASKTDPAREAATLVMTAPEFQLV